METVVAPRAQLRWLVTTLLAIFAGAGADRLMVESRLASFSEQIKKLQEVPPIVQRISDHQIRNEQLIDEHTREIENLESLKPCLNERK